MKGLFTNEKEEEFTFVQKWFPTSEDARKIERLRDNYATGTSELMYRWTRSIALASALSVSAFIGIGNRVEYSQGTRTGMINKISKEGLFWKTYEGEMALEGMVSGGNFTSANIWHFSLDKQAKHGENQEELAEKIRTYVETGTKVKVSYVKQLSHLPWRSGTSYFIQSVEPIKAK